MTTTQLSERDFRIAKAQALRAMGINPYAQKFDKKDSIGSLISQYPTNLADGQSSPFRTIDEILANPRATISTAWRLMLYRSHGKLSFGKLMDENGEIQLMFHRDRCGYNLPEPTVTTKEIQRWDLTPYKLLEKYVDVGDFLGVHGELFYTHKGELTLFVSEFKLLSKAIRPLGDKFHGISGQETAYRQRYLDMLFNRSTLDRMKLRSKFIRTLREFYRLHDFIELETPILGFSASGAAAQPFVTHHNDFDLEMYLRIAPEIALKMATVGWLERVFEIGKDFRNEGSSPSHHQEFTVSEHYVTYRGYEENMKFTEQMFDYLFDHIPELSRKVNIADKEWVVREVDFTTPWARIDYIAQIKKDSWIDVSSYGPQDEAVLRQLIRDKGFERVGLETQGTATMIDYLYKKVTRPKIVWPAFIYNYPKTMQPLARSADADPKIAEQFQCIVNGWEILKAYSELVDPIEQQANFDEQAGALAAGDEEATKWDDEFVTSMEYGMPCQSGRWMGLERIFAMLTEQSNIRDVIMFPMMKPVVHQDSIAKADTMGEDNIDYGALPTRKAANELTEKYLSDTKLHCEQVAHVMEYFAKKLGQDTDPWYLAGLLHDIDWDHINKDASQHLGEQFESIVAEINLPAALIQDIQSHYSEKTWVPVDLVLRRYLASVDELSGLIYAYARMRPEGFEGMSRSSLNKKIKDKNFAAGVSREHVKHCETYLNIPLEEFAMEVVEAMKSFE